MTEPANRGEARAASRSFKPRPGFILALILLLAAALRFGTFYLPHAVGDQLMYTALALKLDHFGMSGYSLHRVNILKDSAGMFGGLQLAPEGNKGDVLRIRERENIFYYTRETLTNMPPLYAHLLTWSHRLFSIDDERYPIVQRNLGWGALKIRPFLFLQVQFYAVWINFALALVLVALTYRLGALAYDRTVGLIAAAFIALNPVDLLSSQRVWADELLTCLFAGSAILLIRGFQMRSLGRLVAAGVCCGLAITTKGTGLFLLAISAAALAIAPMLFVRDESARERVRFGTKAAAAFVVGALPFALAWHGLMYAHYGTPLYMPQQEGIATANEWYRALAERNRLGQLYYFVTLFPAFAFFYIEAGRQLIRRAFTFERLYLIALPLGCAALLIYTNAREERYLLPAYSMIAVVAAAGLHRTLSSFGTLRIQLWQQRAIAAALIAVVLVTSLLAADRGLTLVMSNGIIFPIR